MSKHTNMPKKVLLFAWLMVLWNAIGVAAYFVQVTMTPEAIAQLPKAQQSLYENIPLWSYIAYSLAVFGGFIGSLLLALGKKLAFVVLVVSLAGVIVQQYYNFVVIDSIALMSAAVAILPAIVTLLSFILVLVSQRGVKAGWLH